jgi:hypothetical protein
MMALSADGLFEQIKTKVLDKQYDDSETARNAMASTISSYVASNAKVIGAYVGIIPGTPPTPSTLTAATGKLEAMSTKLELGTSAGALPWLTSALATTLTWQCVADSSWNNAKSVIIATPPTLPDLSSLNTPQDVWKEVCKAIITSIITSVPMPAATSATDGSTGTITWASIS